MDDLDEKKVKDAIALVSSIGRGRFEDAKRWLGAGADPRIRMPGGRQLNAREAAALHGVDKILELTLAKGEPPTEDEAVGLLRLAAEAGSAKCVKRMLRLIPGRLDEPDLAGDTPLMRAAMAKKGFEAVKALLEAGADPRRKNAMGQSAIWQALRAWQPDRASWEALLRAAPEQVWEADRNGVTGMELAARKGEAAVEWIKTTMARHEAAELQKEAKEAGKSSGKRARI